MVRLGDMLRFMVRFEDRFKVTARITVRLRNRIRKFLSIKKKYDLKNFLELKKY